MKLTFTTDFMTIDIYNKKPNSPTICNDICFTLEAAQSLELQADEIWHKPLINLNQEVTLDGTEFSLRVYDLVENWKLSVIDEENLANNTEYTSQILHTLTPNSSRPGAVSSNPFSGKTFNPFKNIIPIVINKDLTLNIVGRTLTLYIPKDLYDIHYKVNSKAIRESHLQLRYYSVAIHPEYGSNKVTSTGIMFDTKYSMFKFKDYKLLGIDDFMETYKETLKIMGKKKDTYQYYGSTKPLRSIFMCLGTNNPTSRQKICIWDMIKLTFDKRYTLSLELSNITANIKVDGQKLLMDFTLINPSMRLVKTKPQTKQHKRATIISKQEHNNK